LHSLSSMLDGRWKQGRRMTSWFDVSAHDLHGVHKSPSEVSNNRTTHRPECDEFQYLLKQVMIFDGMVQIRAVQLHPNVQWQFSGCYPAWLHTTIVLALPGHA
jgi:hypothetical protein